jgi:hypothetical protein
MAKVERGGRRKREIVNLRENSAAGEHVDSAAGILTLQGYGGIDDGGFTWSNEYIRES